MCLSRSLRRNFLVTKRGFVDMRGPLLLEGQYFNTQFAADGRKVNWVSLSRVQAGHIPIALNTYCIRFFEFLLMVIIIINIILIIFVMVVTCCYYYLRSVCYY